MAGLTRGGEGTVPRRVLVTGAFGFVGRWLTSELLARDPAMEIVGWRMHGERSETGDRRLTAEVVDLTDRAAVFEAVAGAQPTAVIHLAAISVPREATLDPQRAWNVNLFGTANLAEAVLAHAPDARFIHVSSSEIYGGSFARMPKALDEAALLEPLNTYALTKSAADLMVGKLAHEGLRAIRMRPFNHTGPGQSDIFVVASLASQIAKIEHGLTKPILYVGNTKVERDILDVRDIVRAYADAAMLERSEFNEVLNLASGRTYTIGGIADRLCAMAKVKIAIEVDPKRVRAHDLERTLGNADRAHAVLGWRPTIGMDQTLRDVLEYWRALTAPASRETKGG